MDLKRVFRHLFWPHWWVLRALPPKLLQRVEQAVAASESAHGGELRVVVEANLPLSGLWRGHPVLAQVGHDGHIPGLSQGDGEAGGGGAGADDGCAELAGFVDHFAGDAAATQHYLPFRLNAIQQRPATQLVQAVVPP